MKNVDRWIWNPSQRFRVHILIDDDHWVMEGFPAESKKPVDDVAENQLDLLKIYEEYGLYDVGVVDRAMGWIEAKVPVRIKMALQRIRGSRKKWRREGTFKS